jgi:integrase
MVGSLEQYPNETAAQKAVAALRADINAENPRTSLTPISVQTLVEHYREKELGPDCTKTRKTQVTYVGYFRKWILPRWGSYHVTEVKAVAVEQWLRSLKYANGSKAKARNIMSAVFNHAVRWEWLDVNPIRMVRQSAKRTRMPIVLSIEQIAALLRILKEPTRTMVFLAVFTGLRVGELLGLKWKHIDFQKWKSMSFARSSCIACPEQLSEAKFERAGLARRSSLRSITARRWFDSNILHHFDVEHG